MSVAAIGGLLSFHRPPPSNIAPPSSEGLYESQVSALSPAIYLKFAGALADSSGAGRNGTLVGSGGSFVAALVADVGVGNLAFDTEGTAGISIAHASADTALTFPSDWKALVNANPGVTPLNLLAPYRFIADATFTLPFKVNALPAVGSRAVIVNKSNSQSPLATGGPPMLAYAETHPAAAAPGSTVSGGGFDAYFDSNGAVHVEVRSFRGRLCRIRTPNGAVAVGATTYHLTVQLSYDGVAAWLNGAKFEEGLLDGVSQGIANLDHVFGLAADIRRVIFRNNYPWMIGRASWDVGGNSQANIVVDEFCVFLRRPSTTITQAEVNILAQQSSTPAALPHYIWGRLTVNENTYAGTAGTTQRIQNAMADVRASGGGTVLVNAGTYIGNVTPESNVRLRVNGSGTVNINGWYRAGSLAVTALGVGTGTLAVGGRTLTVPSHGRAVGDIIGVLGPFAAEGVESPLRHDRSYNLLSDSNSNVQDGQTFEIASVTSSTMTFVGAGSMYEFTQANRDRVYAVTPKEWIALEGDLRFVSTDTITIRSTKHFRFVGIRTTNTSTSDAHALFIGEQVLFGQVRDMTLVNGTLSAGIENDGLTCWLGSSDIIFKDCAAHEGRHAADLAGHTNHGTSVRIEWHNVSWSNINSRAVAGSRAAFGTHGGAIDCLYWNLSSNWGGPSINGVKPDGRWMVCGDPAVAGSGAIAYAWGVGDKCLRDIHIIRPNQWFAGTAGTVGFERNYLENITYSVAPTGNTHLFLRYGTGADVNTYSNVDGASASWQEV